MAFTYTIAADPEALGRDADNSDFAIENPDKLELATTTPTLTPGTKKVTVKAVDGGSGEFGYGFFDVVINPAVTDIALNQTNIPVEGDSSGLVGTLSTTGGTASYTYALVAGTGDTDNSNYSIQNTDEIHVASGSISEPSDSVRVEVTDSTGYQFSKAITIQVHPITGTASVACTGSPATLYDDDPVGTDYCTLETTTTPAPP
jgi:hypothetical protein